jgi:hypothetical protein
MNKTSKFSAVFKNRQSEELEIESENARADTPIEMPTIEIQIDPDPVQPAIVQETSSTKGANVPHLPSEFILPPVKKMGRPAGKRSDPKYTQVTAYIQSETYRNVKVALLLDGDGQEFSELIEDLLTEYLNTRKSK